MTINLGEHGRIILQRYVVASARFDDPAFGPNLRALLWRIIKEEATWRLPVDGHLL